MPKYLLDRELAAISKIKMPANPALFPLMNSVIGLSRCDSQEDISVNHHSIKGYDGAELDLLAAQPRHHEGPLPCMLFCHGGAFVLRASFAHHEMAKRYAGSLPCRVICPDYSLAPAHPFPAAAEDCCLAYRWALALADDAPLIIAGDSAGGDLALAVSLMARDRGLRMPDALLLIYPVTDRRMTSDSMRQYADAPVFDAKLCRMMWDAYLGDAKPERPEYASPLEAASFAGMPPTYIEVAQFDALRDEGIELGQRLRSQGIPVDLHEVKGACHGFEVATKSRLLKACVERRIDWLRDVLRRRESAGHPSSPCQNPANPKAEA